MAEFPNFAEFNILHFFYFSQFLLTTFQNIHTPSCKNHLFLHSSTSLTSLALCRVYYMPFLLISYLQSFFLQVSFVPNSTLVQAIFSFASSCIGWFHPLIFGVDTILFQCQTRIKIGGLCGLGKLRNVSIS